MNLSDYSRLGNLMGALSDIEFSCIQIKYLLGTNMPTDLYKKLISVNSQLELIVLELKSIAENE